MAMNMTNRLPVGSIVFEGVSAHTKQPYIRQTTPFPTRVPKDKYNITITGYEFKATETLELTEDELEKHINTLLDEGYSHAPTPTTKVIYPAHVICKIKVEKNQD